MLQLVVESVHGEHVHGAVAYRPGRPGRSQLSAAEWRVRALNANFRSELSFPLRDVETGTAAGVLLVVSWEADTAATGIRDAYFRVIATSRHSSTAHSSRTDVRGSEPRERAGDGGRGRHRDQGPAGR